MGQRGEDCPAVTVPIIRSTGRTGRIILIVGENISCQYVRDDSFHHLSPENDDYNYVPPTDLSHLVLLDFLISLSILVHQMQDQYGWKGLELRDHHEQLSADLYIVYPL